MKLPSKLFALTACATLLFSLSLPVLAQPKPAKSDAKPKPAADASKDTGLPKVEIAVESDPWHRRVPELQFDNVPLSEVASFLSDQFPEINFVLHPAVKDIPILLKLRSVTLDDIFTALDIATPGTGQGIDPVTGLPAPGGVVQIAKLNDRMVSFTYRQASAPEVTRPVCRAFSLSRYLAGKSDKDVDIAMREVEDTLNVCWDMLQKADHSNTKAESPQLKLHRGTKLLIVVGQPGQVEVVEQVITQLEDGGSGGFGGGRSSGGLIDPNTGLPLPPGYGVPGIPSTPKPPGSR